MALLSAVQAKLSGTVVTYVAASAGGDTFRYSERTTFRVKNGGGSAITVTLVVPGNTEYGQAQPDISINVAAGAEVVIGPMTPGLIDSATGLVGVTYSGVTSVTVALVTA